MLTRERFDQIVKGYLPKGWKICHSPFPDQACLGMADPSTKTIYAPHRHSVEALLLYLHEVGHIALGHTRVGVYHYVEDMSWRFELQAEQWAYRTARKERVTVSASRLHIMKSYIRGRYQRHLSVCKLYKVEPKSPATRAELKWMELEG